MSKSHIVAKSCIVAKDKLILTDGDIEVLPNTTSNLNKKKLENNLRILKEKSKKSKNEFIIHDSNAKLISFIAILVCISAVATYGLTSIVNSLIMGIIGLTGIVFSLKEDDKRELIRKQIKCINEMIVSTRNEYMKECAKQKTIQKPEDYDGCVVQEFSYDDAASKIERFLMLITLYESYKKKYLKYYRKNRSLKGLNFQSEEERIFLERVLLCDLGVETDYISVQENGRSLVKK